MKTRIVQTKFWDDPTVIDAPMEARYLFMYYLTCPHIGMTGIFEISDKDIYLKTGLSEKQLIKAKAFLQENGKVRFFKTWVKIVNAEKYNNYAVGIKNTEAYKKELASIDDTVLQALDSTIGGVFDTSNTTHNTEIRKQKTEKEESVREKPTIADLTPDVLQGIAQDYHLPLAFVISKADDMKNWIASNGKTYRDYPAALRNWVKRDAEKIIQVQTSGSKSFDAVPYLEGEKHAH
jgi:hypothetical protein